MIRQPIGRVQRDVRSGGAGPSGERAGQAGLVDCSSAAHRSVDRDHSPMTLHKKPIMMKNPLNIAMSASPP
jgi:hypothetical protein